MEPHFSSFIWLSLQLWVNMGSRGKCWRRYASLNFFFSGDQCLVLFVGGGTYCTNRWLLQFKSQLIFFGLHLWQSLKIISLSFLIFGSFMPRIYNSWSFVDVSSLFFSSLFCQFLFSSSRDVDHFFRPAWSPTRSWPLTSSSSAPGWTWWCCPWPGRAGSGCGGRRTWRKRRPEKKLFIHFKYYLRKWTSLRSVCKSLYDATSRDTCCTYILTYHLWLSLYLIFYDVSSYIIT